MPAYVNVPYQLKRRYEDIAGLPILGAVITVTVALTPSVLPTLVLAAPAIGSGWYGATRTFLASGEFIVRWSESSVGALDGRDELISVELTPSAAGPVAAGVVVGTYSGNPAASDLDWIRFTIQDTGPSYSGEPWYWADTEIAGVLVVEGNATLAAAAVLFAWARRLMHNPDFRIGRFSESWNAAATGMNEKAAELLAQHASKVGQMGFYVGGISVSDKAAKAADSDRTRGSFARGQMDNPDAGWGR